MDQRVSGGRAWVGAVLAGVPHVLILVLMGLDSLRYEGSDRAFAALVALLEIYVLPAGLVAAIVVRFSRRWRSWFAGVLAGTLCGAASVLLVAAVVGSSA